MEIQDHITDLTDKINKLRPLVVGDRIIHKATGLCGTVEAIESYSRTEGQMITVALFNGKHMRGISRLEFALHSNPSLEQQVFPALNRTQSGREQVNAIKDMRTDQWIREAETAISVALEGTISDASILDELC